jgi:membrane-associated phospholipid phosphatase
LLSESLNTARDGITGFWTGEKTVPHSLQDLRLPRDETYLDKIGMPGQAAVVESKLASKISVVGPEGEATLKCGGAAITKISRPSPEFFEADLDWVRAYSDLRSDRLTEIHMQLDDLLSYFGALSYLDEGRRRYTLMMLDIARRLAIHVERQMKYYCRAPRPIDFATEVQPIIQTPDHSSYPSGHATEAFAIATVFHRLSTGQGPSEGITGTALPFKLAHRIAANRTVAGVHFPIDSQAGAWVGCYVGELLCNFAAGGKLLCGDMPEASFILDDQNQVATDEEGRPKTRDFLLSTMPKLAVDRDVTIERCATTAALWTKANAEWPPLPNSAQTP